MKVKCLEKSNYAASCVNSRGETRRNSRTFADAARVKGANTYTISKALGHARLSTTEKYLKSFDQNAVDEINDIFE